MQAGVDPTIARTEPRVPARSKLHYDKIRAAWVVLGRDRVFVLDGLGAEVVRRCDGRTSAAAIAEFVGREFGFDPGEVLGAIEELLESGVVVK